jgi:hypothetical protein
MDDSMEAAAAALRSLALDITLVVINSDPNSAAELLDLARSILMPSTLLCVNPASLASDEASASWGEFQTDLRLVHSGAAWPSVEILAEAYLSIEVLVPNGIRMSKFDLIPVKCHVSANVSDDFGVCLGLDRLGRDDAIRVVACNRFQSLATDVHRSVGEFALPSKHLFWSSNGSTSGVGRFSCILTDSSQTMRPGIDIPRDTLVTTANRLSASALLHVAASNDKDDTHECSRRASLSPTSRIPRLKPLQDRYQEGRCSLWNVSSGLDSLQCALITQSDALQCLNGSSIAFAGDSQMRDLAYATAIFLLDGSRSMSRADVDAKGSANKFSAHFRRAEPYGVMSFPSNFPHALESDVRTTNWHVDFYDARFPDWSALCEIANGGGLHEYAYVFVQTGLHDFIINKQEALATFTERHVAPLLTISNTTVWLPMNRQCAAKLHPSVDRDQVAYAAACNKLGFERLARSNRRYLDLNAVFPDTEVCDVSADGLHMKLTAEIRRSRAMLYQLCFANSEKKRGF